MPRRLPARSSRSTRRPANGSGPSPRCHEDIAPRTGTANVWTAMSVDEGLGLVYLPVSSPSPNYWGGNRTEKIPLATSTTAVNLETGEVVWSRQWVHHDIWDYDINSAPTLMDITVGGKQIPALMQATKMGFLFVVDRRTGKTCGRSRSARFRAETAPSSGEVYAPTQPFPTKPAPLLDQSKKPGIWKVADPSAWASARGYGTSSGTRGCTRPRPAKAKAFSPTLIPRAGCNGAASLTIPRAETAIVNFSHVVQYIKLYPRKEYEQHAGGSGNEQGFYPQEGAPYGMSLRNALNWLGMPCWEPPFGEIAAIDMTTGDIKWRRPIGASQKWGFYMPESLGSVTIGGPAVTAGGVIFIGASMDAKVRAYSLADGKELWSDIVQAPAVSNPAVYEYKGREYVAFTAGETRSSRTKLVTNLSCTPWSHRS